MPYQIGNLVNLIARVDWVDAVDENINPTGHVADVVYTRSDVIFGAPTIPALQIKSYIYGYSVSKN
jgi:hypothetical protein